MTEGPAAYERVLTRPMKAVRVHKFGGLEAIMHEEVSRPAPGEGQVLVRVKAAGVGPWDAWVRAGKSALPQPLPLILGSDLSGLVEDVGPGVSDLRAFLRPKKRSSRGRERSLLLGLTRKEVHHFLTIS
jgi:NADPH:quinone reductase-like Zn-dependent oxidoreductase